MSDNNPSPPQTMPAEAYRRMCEHASAALIATDRQFNVVFWNASASRLLGIEPQQMLGGPIEAAVPTDRRKLFARLLRRTLARNETSQFEIRLPRTDDDAMDLLVVLSPIPDASGAPDGVAAWIVDESHRKRMAEQLAQAEKIASLGTLAGGVAHHFNNILGGVATFVDFALTSGDPSAMRRALQMTAEAASRASKITQSLLSFAEQDPHRADLADLTEVVLTFTHLVERPLAERDIRLHLKLRPVPVTAVEANRMHHVLGNLLSNAEEAMPDGGQITLSLRQDNSNVVLSFTDTGRGIDPKHLPLVFEPFFTTKGLLAGGDKGNPGLGLSVVHGIVVEMGGQISVTSQPGKGARFDITFPVTTKDNA